MASSGDFMDGQHAAKLLQSAEQDSQQMVQTSGSPRGFTTTLVAVSAVVLTLFQAYPPQAFWTALLYIPLILWYVLARRRRAKPRTLADTPSLLAGAYAGYFFLGILLVNCMRFWEAAQAEEVVAKILVTFISCMFLVAKMQAAYNMARLEDGNDQVV